MSYIYPNVDPLFLRQRKGTEDDPYIYLEDTNYVFQGAIVLKEIPSYKDTLEVFDSNGAKFNKADSIDDIGINEYMIDYSDGLVYVHRNHEGAEFTIKYWGTGYISLPSTRIFVPNSSEDPLLSLQNILDNVEEGTAVIETVKNIEFKDEYDPSMQYRKWNFVTFANKTFVATKTIQGLSPSESSDWKLVSSGVGFAGVYDASKTYSIGDIVADESSKNIYFSKIMDNTYPLTDQGSWEPMLTLDDLIERLNQSMQDLQDFQDLLEASDQEREQKETSRQLAFEDLLEEYESFHSLVVADEEVRNASEGQRNSSETERQQMEEVRQSNEVTREANESARVTAEAARVETFNALLQNIQDSVNATVGDIDGALVEIRDLKTTVNNLVNETNETSAQIDTKMLELSGFAPIDEFDIDMLYKKHNIVSHQGSSYMAREETQGNDVTDQQFWFQIASRGLDNLSISIDSVVPDESGEIHIDDLGLVRQVDFDVFSDDITSIVGDPTALTTASSENLVEAINELKRRIDNIVGIMN